MIIDIDLEVRRICALIRESAREEVKIVIMRDVLKEFLERGDENGSVSSIVSSKIRKSSLPRGISLFDFLAMTISCEGYSFNDSNISLKVADVVVYSNAWFILEKLSVTSCSEWLPKLLGGRTRERYNSSRGIFPTNCPSSDEKESDSSSHSPDTRRDIDPIKVFKLSNKPRSYDTFEEMIIESSSHNHELEHIFSQI